MLGAILGTMLAGIIGIKIGYILCGIIWSIALGFAAGNYACSLVHRLPRGRLLLDKPPYCGTCGTLLQTKDLFPVVSALLLRHRCRYCGTAFPASHTWTELLVGLLFVLAFFRFNFSEQYVLVVCLGTFIITLTAIEANERMVMGKVLMCIMVFALVFRTLQDHTIMNALLGALDGAFVSAIVWRKQIKRVGHIFVPPTPVVLTALGGLCAGNRALPMFLVLFAGFYAVDWVIRKIFHAKNAALITLAFGLASMLLVLYPELMPAYKLSPHGVLYRHHA